MKTLTLLAVCACGLSMAANAHASSRGLGDQLVSAGDNLISAVTASLSANAGSSDTATSTAESGTDTHGDVPSTARTSSEPVGDLLGPAPEATHKSGGGDSGHHSGSHSSQALGWQSLLPGSIQ